jgi:hypothetical protein
LLSTRHFATFSKSNSFQHLDSTCHDEMLDLDHNHFGCDSVSSCQCSYDGSRCDHRSDTLSHSRSYAVGIFSHRSAIIIVNDNVAKCVRPYAMCCQCFSQHLTEKGPFWKKGMALDSEYSGCNGKTITVRHARRMLGAWRKHCRRRIECKVTRWKEGRNTYCPRWTKRTVKL